MYMIALKFWTHLPGTQVELALSDGNVQRRTKHAALDMPWHVIIPLISMNPWR